MAIGNKRYSHLMPRHKRQAGKILERDIHYVVPQPNYWGNMSPVPQFRRLCTWQSPPASGRAAYRVYPQSAPRVTGR